MTTFREAIAGMKGRKSNEEILIAWWDKEWFEDMLNRKISDDEWAQIRRRCEKSMEYAGWGDDLTWAAEEALDAMKNDEVSA